MAGGDTSTGVKGRVDGVVTFLDGDYSSGSGSARDGFEMRLRLPAEYQHDEVGIDLNAKPEGVPNLISIKGNYVHLEDWEAGPDDRFYITVIYLPRNPAKRQRLAIYADDDLVSEMEYRAGDSVQLAVSADTIAFDPSEPNDGDGRGIEIQSAENLSFGSTRREAHDLSDTET